MDLAVSGTAITKKREDRTEEAPLKQETYSFLGMLIGRFSNY